MPVIYLWPFINVWYDHSKAGFYGVMYKWTCLDFSVIKNYNRTKSYKISLWIIYISSIKWYWHQHLYVRGHFFFNWQSNFFHNIRYYNIPVSILYYHLLSTYKSNQIFFSLFKQIQTYSSFSFNSLTFCFKKDSSSLLLSS